MLNEWMRERGTHESRWRKDKCDLIPLRIRRSCECVWDVFPRLCSVSRTNSYQKIHVWNIFWWRRWNNIGIYEISQDGNKNFAVSLSMGWKLSHNFQISAMRWNFSSSSHSTQMLLLFSFCCCSMFWIRGDKCNAFFSLSLTPARTRFQQCMMRT